MHLRKLFHLLKILVIPVCLFITPDAAFCQDDKNSAEKNKSHTFYITGNTGIDQNSSSSAVLQQITEDSKAEENASLLIIGNLTPPGGYPSEGKKREQINLFLQKDLIDPLKNFNGKVIYTPGVNEWNKGGHDNIDDLESFLQDQLDSDFWPSDGCPLEKEDINDDVVLVMVDSQWFLEDWDDHPYINNDCDLKTREQFLTEFKDDLKDSQGKTVIVAMHHPIMSNTRFGFINKIGGFSKQSFENKELRSLRGRLETIGSEFEDVIFVSGNDRNLQYLEDDRNPQIISGAAATTQPVKAQKEENFASEEQGFAKLIVFEDGSSIVEFYEITPSGTKKTFSKKIKKDRISLDKISYKPASDFGKTTKASIYSSEETKKSGLYEWFFGKHYRDIYSREIEAPVLFLEDLPGNPVPISEGGGQQSRSLRLLNDEEHEYTLRALRKSAIQLMQTNFVKEHYVRDFLDNTVAERFVSDFFTTAHPYAPFATSELAEQLGILHANPKIFYVPKQKGLGIYNDNYGDELYMLEEHVGDENRKFETFGSPEDILSTTDLLAEMLESKDFYVDEPSYIKARLFDMLIGDWDRHQDQWRWAQFDKEDGKKEFRPIPRDRDHAFSKYDGPAIALLKTGFPILRKLQSYDEDIKNIKYFNLSGYPLDKALITGTDWEVWKEQVDFIQNQLTNDAIEKAFEELPEAVKDKSIASIKKSLKERLDNLEEIARSYFSYLNKFKVITGTTEDDRFLIQRNPGGITDINIFNNDSLIFKDSYSSGETGEIWIYGLDGEDQFKIVGQGSDLVKLKIIGGEENDLYDFQNTRNAKIYDYKSKPNRILNPSSKKWLVDSYNINNYDVQKRKYWENKILPNADYGGDEGLSLGFSDIFTTYGLARNPFTTQHTLGANYFFATNGFEILLSGEYAHVFYNWNLGFEAYYSSPNFTLNYFGSGMDTEYDRDDVSRDYNRVRIEQWNFEPSLIRRNNRGSSFHFRAILESMEVKNDGNRFVGQVFTEENDVFDKQLYAGGEITYQYLNKSNNPAFPIRGMQFDLTTGYKRTIENFNNKFGYIKPVLSIDYPLHPSGYAVLATEVGGNFILGDDYEFYHGAIIGGNQNLRGYRNDRFNGRASFYQSTDLRVGLSLIRTNYIPLIVGVSAGFDYGRVWVENDPSERWRNDYGGSVWISGASVLTGNFGYYQGDEGGRFVFIFGFNF